MRIYAINIPWLCRGIFHMQAKPIFQRCAEHIGRSCNTEAKPLVHKRFAPTLEGALKWIMASLAPLPING